MAHPTAASRFSGKLVAGASFTLLHVRLAF
jgi:hypothetical protein